MAKNENFAKGFPAVLIATAQVAFNKDPSMKHLIFSVTDGHGLERGVFIPFWDGKMFDDYVKFLYEQGATFIGAYHR